MTELILMRTPNSQFAEGAMAQGHGQLQTEATKQTALSCLWAARGGRQAGLHKPADARACRNAWWNTTL